MPRMSATNESVTIWQKRWLLRHPHDLVSLQITTGLLNSKRNLLMDVKQSVLVIISFIFIAVLYVMILVKGPRLSLSARAHFDRSRTGAYLRFLGIVVVLSFLLGMLVTAKFSIAIE